MHRTTQTQLLFGLLLLPILLLSGCSSGAVPLVTTTSGATGSQAASASALSASASALSASTGCIANDTRTALIQITLTWGARSREAIAAATAYLSRPHPNLKTSSTARALRRFGVPIKPPTAPDSLPIAKRQSSIVNRDAVASSAALSAVITIQGANPEDGTDYAFTVNRDMATLGRFSQTVSSPSPARIGCRTVTIQFYSQPDAGGDVIGTAQNTVGINTDGFGLGDVATEGVIQSLKVPAGQYVGVGETKDLTFAAFGPASSTTGYANSPPPQPMIAVTPGSGMWTVVNGANRLKVAPNGSATGLARGPASVVVTLDGITSTSGAFLYSNGYVPDGLVGVGPVGAVLLDPIDITINAGGQVNFSNFVIGGPVATSTQYAQGPSYSVQEGAAGGSISLYGQGNYTAPAINGTFHVVATSPLDPTQNTVATVHVVNAQTLGQFRLSPLYVSLFAGDSIAFTAFASGVATPSVTFGVQEGASGGSFAGNVYTAPATAGTYHVVATDTSNPALQTSVAVKVVARDPTSPLFLSPLAATILIQDSINVNGYTTNQDTYQFGPAFDSADIRSNYSLNSLGGYTLSNFTLTGMYHMLLTDTITQQTAKSAITVLSPPGTSLPGGSVTVSPAQITLFAGDQVIITPDIVGAGHEAFSPYIDTLVTFSVQEGAAGGTVNSNGVYISPSTPATYHVVVTNKADTSQQTAVTVVVL